MGELQKRVRNSGILNEQFARIDTILEIVEDMMKEFPEFVGYGGSHDELFDAETKRFEWFKKWLMPTAEEVKSEEKEVVE